MSTSKLFVASLLALVPGILANDGTWNEQPYASQTQGSYGGGWGMSQAAAVTPSTTPSGEWGSWGQGTTIAAAVTSSTTMMNWGGGWPAESSTTSTCDEEWPMETVPPTFTTPVQAACATTSCGTPWGGAPSWMGMDMNSSMQAPLIQVVHVGGLNGELIYWPEKVVAPVGSIVQFQFNPKNHTVSQSAFGTPCQPITLTNPENITETSPGIFSGYVPVSELTVGISIVENISIFNVLINSTAPIWIYCSQGDHCAMGMSMVINEPDMVDCSVPNNKTLEAYQAAAAAMAGSSWGAPPAPGYGSSSAAWGAPSSMPYGSSMPWGASTTTATATVVPQPAWSSSVPWTATGTPATPVAPASTAPAPPPFSPPAPPASVAPSVFNPSSQTTSALPAGISVFTGAAPRVDTGMWRTAAAVGVGAYGVWMGA